MANMELVIKIPEEQYNAIKSDLYNTFSVETKIWGLGAIRNGTPLPKGHGRLIDADVVLNLYKHPKRMYDWDIQAILESTPTIIEAGKAESE